MKFTVDEILYKQAMREIRKKGDDVDKAMENTIKSAGNLVAQEARNRAPSDTGEGKKTIRARKETRKRSKYYRQVWIGPDDQHKYMLFPEYGTESQNSQWFVHGALEDKEDDVIQSIENELRKVLQ